MSDILLNEILLYHHPLCPFCREARLLLSEYPLKGWQEQRINFFPNHLESMQSNDNIFANYIWQQRYPLLQLGDSGSCSGLSAIRQFLDEFFVDSDFYLQPKSNRERIECLEILNAFDQDFYFYITLPLIESRYLPFVCDQSFPTISPAKVRASTARLHVWLLELEKIMAKQNYLIGRSYTQADFCVAAQLSCIDYLGCVIWSHYSELKNWYMKIKSRASMQSLLRDSLPELKPPDHYRKLDF